LCSLFLLIGFLVRLSSYTSHPDFGSNTGGRCSFGVFMLTGCSLSAGLPMQRPTLSRRHIQSPWLYPHPPTPFPNVPGCLLLLRGFQPFRPVPLLLQTPAFSSPIRRTFPDLRNTPLLEDGLVYSVMDQYRSTRPRRYSGLSASYPPVGLLPSSNDAPTYGHSESRSRSHTRALSYQGSTLSK